MLGKRCFGYRGGRAAALLVGPQGDAEAAGAQRRRAAKLEALREQDRRAVAVGDGDSERKTGAGAGCREEKPVCRRTRTATRGVPANSDFLEMTVGKAIVR